MTIETAYTDGWTLTGTHTSVDFVVIEPLTWLFCPQWNPQRYFFLSTDAWYNPKIWQSYNEAGNSTSLTIVRQWSKIASYHLSGNFMSYNGYWHHCRFFFLAKKIVLFRNGICRTTFCIITNAQKNLIYQLPMKNPPYPVPVSSYLPLKHKKRPMQFSFNCAANTACLGINLCKFLFKYGSSFRHNF